jgi:hypothetical protein
MCLLGYVRYSPAIYQRSSITNPSQDLAERLAVAANILCGSADYFTAADFITTPRRGRDD